jgi:hypothetical protein
LWQWSIDQDLSLKLPLGDEKVRPSLAMLRGLLLSIWHGLSDGELTGSDTQRTF